MLRIHRLGLDPGEAEDTRVEHLDILHPAGHPDVGRVGELGRTDAGLEELLLAQLAESGPAGREIGPQLVHGAGPGESA